MNIVPNKKEEKPYTEQFQCLFRKFLMDFKLPSEDTAHYQYLIQDILESKTKTLHIDYNHMVAYSTDLAKLFQVHYYQLYRLHQNVLHDLVKQFALRKPQDFSSFDNQVFNIAIIGFPIQTTIRNIRSSEIGKLFCISGIVIRKSKVLHKLYNGTFRCQMCGTEIFDIVQSIEYKKPTFCTSKTCGNKSKFDLCIDKSIFIDWQDILIQEDSSEVPPNSMPNTIKAILQNEFVEKTKPGDRCLFTGTPVAIPDKNKNCHEHSYQLSFLVCYVKFIDAEADSNTINI